MRKDEYRFYTDHRDEIINGHIGEFVAITGSKVIGYYRNRMDAFGDLSKKEIKAGAFIVHKCEPAGEPVINFASAWTY